MKPPKDIKKEAHEEGTLALLLNYFYKKIQDRCPIISGICRKEQLLKKIEN